jgi:pSer/pThr/pTyr-binding forkhead associated (FHA) protein
VLRLLVISGPRAGDVVDVDRELVIGRYHADIVIEDPELSRRHLGLRPDGDELIVEDLGSTNGTFVDERQIRVPTRLGHGEKVKLGATVLEVQAATDAGETLVRAPADLDVTRLRSVPEEMREPTSGTHSRQAAATPVDPSAAVSTPPQDVAAPQEASPPKAEATPKAEAPAVAVREEAPSAGARQVIELAAFQPPSVRRGGGLASRSWIPVALSFGTAILTALALVIYFAER